MVVDYIEAWCMDTISRPRTAIGNRVEVVGIHDFHTGPGWQYGRISVVAEPATDFSVHFDLPDEQIAFFQQDHWLDEAVFGIIDVLATVTGSPILGVALRITEADHDPVRSSRIAFRMAGRDAGRRIIGAGYPFLGC